MSVIGLSACFSFVSLPAAEVKSCWWALDTAEPWQLTSFVLLRKNAKSMQGSQWENALKFALYPLKQKTYLCAWYSESILFPDRIEN